ncbi:MAG: hypothetical protein L6Q99_11730 [Planctomycetes bacterium]|nr:hypothetical protein [Planctomycetota bacterium]
MLRLVVPQVVPLVVLLTPVPVAELPTARVTLRHATASTCATASSDGAWRLSVEGSSPNGAGKATYVLTHDTRVAWKGTRPYTLLDVAVAMDGTVAGAAYTEGHDGWRGECLLITLGPDGVERGRYATPRRGPREPDGPPEPSFQGVCFAETEGYWLVRARGLPAAQVAADELAEHVVLRIDASTGLPIDRIELPSRRRLGGREEAFLWDVRPVVGRPLLATYWRRANWETRATIGDGARYELVDFEGEVVWTLDRPGEYGPWTDDEPNDLVLRAWHTRPLSVGPDAGRFSVLLASSERRLELVVDSGGDRRGDRGGDAWNVRALGLAPAPLVPRTSEPEPKVRRRR